MGDNIDSAESGEIMEEDKTGNESHTGGTMYLTSDSGENTTVDGNNSCIVAQGAPPLTYQGHDCDGIIISVTTDYLAKYRPEFPDLMDKYQSVPKMRDDLLQAYRLQISLENAVIGKAAKINIPISLPGYVVGKIVLSTGAVRVMHTGSEGTLLVVKHYYRNASTGWKYKWSGTYEIAKEKDPYNILTRIFHSFCPNGSSHALQAYWRELHDALECTINQDNKLVPFRNGVWDYRTEELTEYDDPAFCRKYPDYVVLAALPVYHPYGKGAILKPDSTGKFVEPMITNPDGTTWRPSQMLEDPFDMTTNVGKASQLIILEAMQFMIRKLNGAPGLYHFWLDITGQGHNGKGAIWAMMQRLIEMDIGPEDTDLTATSGRTIAASIDQINDKYVLDNDIMTAYAIVGEESDAATKYIDKCARLKMLSRAQELMFREIYGTPFKFRYNGFLLLQSNGMPRFSEKNDSVISHIVAVPFSKSFDDNRPYIKDDYVKREEVAEWWVYYLTALMPCLSAYDRDALKTLEPYKRDMLAASMTSFQFLDVALPGLKMNYMPADLLYSLYQRWCDRNGVTGPAVVNTRMFQDDLKQYGINNGYGVEYTDAPKRCRKDDIAQMHPALKEYGYSRKLGYSEFVCHMAAMSNRPDASARWQLEPSVILDSNQKNCRIWKCGGLLRRTRWQDIPGFGGDEDADIDNEETAVS